MICINKEYINKELEKDGMPYKKFKLSNKIIDWLFNQYYCEEMCENFYDSEPDFEDELYNMYLDYKDTILMTGLTFWKVMSRQDDLQRTHRFSEQEHTIEELREAYLKVNQMYADYEPIRLKILNWQEPYFKGNWGYSQCFVDSVAKETLKSIQKINVKRDGRLFWAKQDDQIRIYFYGRDFGMIDYWFIFTKRDRRIK